MFTGGAEEEEEEEQRVEMEGTLWALHGLGSALCDVLENGGGCAEGSEDREEESRALGGVKEGRPRASQPSAGDQSQWKLWGLRGAERGTEVAPGWKIRGRAGG